MADMSEHDELLARLDHRYATFGDADHGYAAAAIRSLQAELESAREDGKKIGNFVIALINAISIDKTLPAPLRARAAEMKAAIDYVMKEPK